MSKTEEQAFLEVKEKLDYYRLPTIFPIEATTLLQQILSLLDKSSSNNKENFSFQQNGENGLDSALRHEIGKVVKENNGLHLQLMTAKEQVQNLNYRVSKYTMERSDGASEIAQTLFLKDEREKQILGQLEEVKFKYNELMDLIHEDSAVERRYIKRLLKHRKYEINISERQQRKKSKSKNKKHSEGMFAEIENENRLLVTKLENREAEILRLQQKMEYDGINMNKVIKDFQNNKTNIKVNSLNQRINYLEEENSSMKKQVGHCRKTGGRAEALREQMRKNHEQIKNLGEENKELKRKMKEKQFDVKAKIKEENRKNNKMRKQAEQKCEENEQTQIQNTDLLKKLQFTTKQLQNTKKELEVEREKGMKKEITIDQMKNTQQGGKILNQYEIQSLKQRLDETNDIIIAMENKINKLISENNYYRDEGILKSEAIQNLQRIVDELMKKNQVQRDMKVGQSEFNAQNVLIMRNNLAEAKQLLTMSQSEKYKLEKELNNMAVHYENAIKDKKIYEDQLNKIKLKICDMRSFDSELKSIQSERQRLKAELKKQENLRYRVDSLFKDAERQKQVLRKQIQQINTEFELYEKKTKNHIHQLKMSLTTLEQTNAILELRVKEKEKRMEYYEVKIEQMQEKLKSLTDEILLIQEEKHNLAREKYRIEKRFEEMQKSSEDLRQKEIQIHSLTENERTSEIAWLKKELRKYEQRMKLEQDRMMQLEKMCEVLKLQKENLFNDKLQFLRQNESLRLRVKELEEM